MTLLPLLTSQKSIFIMNMVILFWLSTSLHYDLNFARRSPLDNLFFLFALLTPVAGGAEDFLMISASSFSDLCNGFPLTMYPILSSNAVEIVWCFCELLLPDAASLVCLQLLLFTAVGMSAGTKYKRAGTIFRYSSANSWRYLYCS